MRTRLLLGAMGASLVLVGCSSSASAPMPTASATAVSPSTTPTTTVSSGATRVAAGHVLIVMLENRSYSDIVGNPNAPYLNELASAGRSLTQMHAITHPSQPNYLALFAGSTQGVTDDSCPHTFATPNLGSSLQAAGLTFTGYSEDLPSVGSRICTAGTYARKHVPWTDFRNLPARTNAPLTALPTDYARLPTVSFVIPNLEHDMHDGTIGAADSWLRKYVGPYARWATSHASLLIVTWDEDDHSEANRIPTFIVGAGVTPSRLDTRFTIYSLLRTVEDRYGLPALGASAAAAPIPLT